jgi:hypothetical protein
MRRLLAASLLFVASCSQVPEEEPRPVSTPVPVAPQPREIGTLIGLTGGELIGRLGRPALQIREGNSLKVQFRGRDCVLDAFLYPGAGAQYRVTHVDTRAISGADTPQEACISQIEFAG